MTALLLSALAAFCIAVLLSGPPRRRFHEPEPERPLCDRELRDDEATVVRLRTGGLGGEDQTIARLRRRGGA